MVKCFLPMNYTTTLVLAQQQLSNRIKDLVQNGGTGGTGGRVFLFNNKFSDHVKQILLCIKEMFWNVCHYVASECV